MRALLSVYDKSGIEPFARELVDLGWELISTGGTLTALQAAGIPVTKVADITGFPEILDGRVKTLHPRIHGGLLARLELPEHRAALEEHSIEPIGLVACNLYPFEATVATPNISLADAVEQIDIGGPAMIRAAAKNFQHVAVVVSPTDYESVIAGLRAGSIDQAERRALAARAYAHVSAYDAVVAEYLRGESDAFPEELSFAGRKQQELRYGENPAQRAVAYRRLSGGQPFGGVLGAKQLHGKELSFNNLLDSDAALGALRRFDRPAVSIIKHTIPCGLATHDDLCVAFERALAGDPVSAFGGIVALNRPVDLVTAEQIGEIFFEVIVAPGFDDDALALLQRKKQIRLLSLDAALAGEERWTVRAIAGGLLVQEPDRTVDDPASWTVVTQRGPSAEELRDLVFAWEACRHVKSNAIVLARDEAMLGVGSGQPNRVESARIAVSKAGERSNRSVLASDAFFPFPDGLETAIAAGITAAVQPGGSVRDQEVIAAADKAGIAMLFTGSRHFLH
jgi:phosphoribosylaminoimidazolecarboxamide formyltransferase/IMP cyclohydrolase